MLLLLLTLRNMLLVATITPVNFNGAVFNSTLQHFSQRIQLRLEMRLSKLSSDSDTKPNPCHKMSKLTNNNTSETSKNVTPLLLQLTLNTFNTSMHSSIERYAATTQINSTIYHSFLSWQPLAAPQNMSPTRTGSPIYDPQGIFNFSNRGITDFGIQKLQIKFE